MTFVLSLPGQHGLPLLTPGYLMFFVNIEPDSERQRENSVSRYRSLRSFFSAEVHTAKSSHFHNEINSAPDMRNLFRTFNYLLCPPSPPPTTSITARDFATFITDKTRTISSQFSPPPTQDLHPTTSTAQAPIFSYFKLLLQTSPLQPSYNMSSWPNPLTPSPSNLSHTLTSTHTHYQHISPHRHLPHCVQAGSGNPTAKKPTLNTSLKLQTCLSLPIHSQNTRTSCLQPGLNFFFHRTTNWTGVAIQLRLSYSVTEPLRIAKANSKSSVLILLDLSLLLTPSTSCPPSHHWISLGFHFARFESYFTGWSFRLAWGGEVSKAHQLVNGVPQGSVLGPLLFSTYTTSLGLPALATSCSSHQVHITDACI